MHEAFYKWTINSHQNGRARCYNVNLNRLLENTWQNEERSVALQNWGSTGVVGMFSTYFIQIHKVCLILTDLGIAVYTIFIIISWTIWESIYSIRRKTNVGYEM